MITPIELAWEPDLWRNELRMAFRSSAALLAYLGLPTDPLQTAGRAAAAGDFAVLVPRGFAARMTPGKPDDPLLRQVLADAEETRRVDGFVADPLEETAAAAGAVPGLLQKYRGRALLIAANACAVNCRYCFRRHFPYTEHRPSAHAQALSAIRADRSLREVILSGGDPLLTDDSGLAGLLRELAEIPHIRRIRIHSRMPVVLPERVSTPLLEALQAAPVPVVMVIHANHPQELNAATAAALHALNGVVHALYNQAVLLHGVNDSVAAQVALAERLFEQRVQPYYLHMPDRVRGTHHFFVDDAAASDIYRGMQAALPGYLVPKLVREIPGEAHKSMLRF